MRSELVRPSIISHVVEPSIVSHGLAHRYTNRQVEELQLWHGKFRAGAVLKPDNAGPLLKFLSNLVGQVLQTGNIQIAVSVSVKKSLVDQLACRDFLKSIDRLVLNADARGRPGPQSPGIPHKETGYGRSNLMLFE